MPAVIGTANSFGVFFDGLIGSFGTSYGSTSLVSSIQLGVSFCIGPITSHLVSKFGCRKIIILGSLVAATGLISSGVAQNIITLYVTAGLCTGRQFISNTNEILQSVYHVKSTLLQVWGLALSTCQRPWLCLFTSTKSVLLPVVSPHVDPALVLL